MFVRDDAAVETPLSKFLRDAADYFGRHEHERHGHGPKVDFERIAVDDLDIVGSG